MCSTGLNVRIKEESFANLYSLWQDHASDLRWRGLFALPHWLETWWEYLNPGGTLYLRSVWENEKLCGIAPFYMKDSTACLLGSEDVCDYLDVPVAADRESLFWTALLEDLSKKGIKQMQLGLLRPDSVVFSGLPPLLKEGGKQLTASWETIDVSFEMGLPSDWEGYLKALSKKQRHEVRRKLRRLHEGAKVQYRELWGSDITPALQQTFFELFARSREDKATFLTPEREKFFQTLMERMNDAGLLRMGLLELNNRSAGMTLHFVQDGRVYLYNSGHDPGYRFLSVGLMTKIFCIKESVHQQRHTFDFLKGREVFKQRLGGREVPLFRGVIPLG